MLIGSKLGQYEVHHGVDFDRNPIGVPIYAVGDGIVVSAGNDRELLCGANGKHVCGRFPNFYGRVTIIRLAQSYRGQTLFALYGHQDRIDIQFVQLDVHFATWCTTDRCFRATGAQSIGALELASQRMGSACAGRGRHGNGHFDFGDRVNVTHA